jgi:hypothetical protein
MEQGKAKGLRLVGLLRVSTPSQAGDENEGFDRQREAIDLIAKGLGAAVVKFVEFKGVHGWALTNEPGWQDVLVLLRAGWGLAVQNINRLLRAKDFDYGAFASSMPHRTASGS